jgi:hypothetical protein
MQNLRYGDIVLREISELPQRTGPSERILSKKHNSIQIAKILSEQQPNLREASDTISCLQHNLGSWFPYESHDELAQQSMKDIMNNFLSFSSLMTT